MSVPDEIAKLAALYAEKHGEYGDTEIYSGEVFVGLLPNGVVLKTRSDFARFALFHHLVNKVLRYANNFAAGGHEDSLRDLALYAMMLREIDARPPDRLRDDVVNSKSDGGGCSPSADRRVPRFVDGVGLRWERDGG
jgi:hypothetical protein